jgi:galactose mutarotase-like enzyme
VGQRFDWPPQWQIDRAGSQALGLLLPDLRDDPTVRWPGELELTVSSDCKDWIIYEMEDNGVCVEPWTAPPNSLNMPNSRIVRPGAPLVASMTWAWR